MPGGIRTRVPEFTITLHLRPARGGQGSRGGLALCSTGLSYGHHRLAAPRCSPSMRRGMPDGIRTGALRVPSSLRPRARSRRKPFARRSTSLELRASPRFLYSLFPIPYSLFLFPGPLGRPTGVEPVSPGAQTGALTVELRPPCSSVLRSAGGNASSLRGGSRFSTRVGAWRPAGPAYRALPS